MKFTEEMLKGYEAPLSATEEQKCKNAISMVRDALSSYGYSEGSNSIRKAYDDTYAFTTSMSNSSNGRRIKLFLQGSYANNTNVRTQSDVDIAVILESTFNTKYPPGVTDSTYGFSASSYNNSEFKADIVKILQGKFGNDVERKNKSIKINGNGYRVDTDTVPCMRFRDYSNDNKHVGNYIGGVKITADDGEVIYNYPEQHIENGRTKNIATNYYYKKMVKVMKKMRYLMIDNNCLEAKEVSSFGIESLLWNVPDGFYLEYAKYRHVFLFSSLIDYLKRNTCMLQYYKEANGIKTLCNTSDEVQTYIKFINKLSEFYEYV